MKRFIAFYFLGIQCLLSEAQQVFPENTKVRAVPIVTGINIPWGIAFLPNGDMLVTEIKGTLYHVKNGTKTEIKGVPSVVDEGQGGLLDVAVHPKYGQNGWIYLAYSKPGEKQGLGKQTATTAIGRAKIQDDQLVNFQEIFVADPYATTRHHYGCRILFDKDNFMYFTVGDRGNHFEFPQKLDNHNGKVHRLHDDGTVPKDNPFVKNFSALHSIWSYGHRNPQGMVIHPLTGEIWEHEHGPKGGDEINIIEKGKNYGWPVISYGINYDNTIITKETAKDGMEQPLTYYVPSIAPSGMEFINSDKYGDWKGNLLIGSLSFQYLHMVYLDGKKVVKQEKLLTEIGRVRSIRQGPDGYIYIGVEGKGILKLERL